MPFLPPPAVHADFDGDHRIDSARVLADAKGGFRVIVVRSADPRHAVTIYRTRDARPPYLDTARPGTYRTACGKGYGPDEQHCRYRQITLTANTLMFGYSEASDAAAVWNGRRFDVVWITD
jgi:hypothetical protein